MQFCSEENILVQGRGSAANSVVCYHWASPPSIQLAWNCFSSDFLTAERGEWPDIDLDLPSGDQRESVIQYVYQRYGERGAAMTANVITYRGTHRRRGKWARLWVSMQTRSARLSATVSYLGIPRENRRDSTA